MRWQTTRFDIDLAEPRVMAIVNATPDSFSDGGRALQATLAHCEAALRDGAHLLDIGGESTRPGAAPTPPDEELARVLPVLRHAVTLGVPVSVDTSEPAVMRAALDLGVDIVNDVRALQRRGALALLAAHARAGVCLMHMRGDPATMQAEPHYDDVVAEVADWLAQRAREVQAAGVARERIVLDPGIGFGKSHEHNLALLRTPAARLGGDHPLLVGWSRKGSIGRLTGRPVQQRAAASAAAALASVQRGARIVRVHDVAATVDVLAVWRAAGLMAA